MPKRFVIPAFIALGLGITLHGAWASSTYGVLKGLAPETALASQAAISQAAASPTPTPSDFQTIMSPDGYQLLVPNTWQPAVTSPLPQPRGVTAQESKWLSADGLQQLRVYVFCCFPWTSTHADQDLSLAAQGATDVQVVQSPKPTTVQNADSASIGTETFTYQGAPYAATAVSAIHGQNQFALLLFNTADYASAHPDQIQQIISSFQVTP
jgi:hypothetical protein